MKNLFALFIVLSIAASSLMAWGYTGYYGSYPYTGGWHYPSSYYDGYPQGSGGIVKKPAPEQILPETSQPQYPEKAKRKKSLQSRQSLEQQYDKLIVMFTKDVCPYCQYMKPIMKQVERKFGKDIKFIYADIEENPQYPSQYGFKTVPQIMYFKDGKKLDEHGSGDKTMTVEQVKEKIENFFGGDQSED